MSGEIQNKTRIFHSQIGAENRLPILDPKLSSHLHLIIFQFTVSLMSDAKKQY